MIVEAAPTFVLPTALLSGGFVLRPESEADVDFLLGLYATTREREMAIAPWTPAQKAGFLAQQFYAQRRHYRSYGDSCAFLVLERDGAPVGRLYLNAEGPRLQLVDIALLPACRGQGIGGTLLKALQASAEANGKVLGAHVEKTNPARRLYRRLGFVEIEDQGLYMEIKWSPTPSARRPPRSVGPRDRR